MKAIVTGSCGLIGSAVSNILLERGYQVVGIDNDMRGVLLNASTKGNQISHVNYDHHHFDIRNAEKIIQVVDKFQPELIFHTAAQPAHSQSIKSPYEDFEINGLGTVNILEAIRLKQPDAHLVYVSSSKVYGDNVNKLPFVEQETRFDLPWHHPLYKGYDESMSIDDCNRSMLGGTKLVGDIMVQEYSKIYGIKAKIFRPTCLTGRHHAGTEVHGFLNYLIKCAVLGTPYTCFGYKGKQVRCNIDAYDFSRALIQSTHIPNFRIYNYGGGRANSCSILEACESLKELGYPVNLTIVDETREADHIWSISSQKRFLEDFPNFTIEKNLDIIYKETIDFYKDMVKSNSIS